MGRLLEHALQFMLGHFFSKGSVTFVTAAGRPFTVGDGTGPHITVRFQSVAAEKHLLFDPELAFGEIYTDGSITIENGSIADLLQITLSQPPYNLPGWAKLLAKLRFMVRRWQQFNSIATAKRKIESHYDLDGRLYSLFLDADKQYSCGYFETPDSSLDDAQLAKKRHIAAKVLIRPDQRVLDIGSGWGGLGLYLAEVAGAQVTGVTLSDEQFAISSQRAAEKGLTSRAQFLLEDYRKVPGTFDRIVSVGMFEHVGVNFYDTYFKRCAELMNDSGVMLLHSIGRSEGPGITNPWIAKYIFPGGYIPALSEVLPPIERAGLIVDDIEILRIHYADTLKAWRERFLAHRDAAIALYDERFVRLWEFYLASSEMSFREQNLMVFQIQLSKRQGVVPITRDYIGEEERRLRDLESAIEPKLRLAGE
ncbi:MAG: cyclopropane-fatty-acyl-phospholipid synthase family protein [Xanthobacteraceae bacterium]|nr:cyclopropane-fatty-acyl-phospholipid synthase family protein [Xanthobacteraceae bacterium]